MWDPTKEGLERAATRQREQAKAGREFSAVLHRQALLVTPAEGDAGRPADLLLTAAFEIRRAAEAHERAAHALTKAKHEVA